MIIYSKTSGVHFEAIMPNCAIVIPDKANRMNVEFGVRITNRSERTRQFLLFFVRPSFCSLDGQEIPSFGPNTNRVRQPETSDFAWIEPGECLDFWSEGRFAWEQDKLKFVFEAKHGGVWMFTPFELGKNHLQLTYENPSSVWEIYDGERLEARIEDVWTGKGTTQSVNFQLIESKSE
jgi:hypothetical protein